jgi:hypothetical protein
MLFRLGGFPDAETFTRCQAEYSHLALIEVSVSVKCRMTGPVG